MKRYKSDRAGKRAFVREVLSPLMAAAETGWYGAEYDSSVRGEYVYLLTTDGERSNAVDVTGDSLMAIVLDVFKRI